METNPGIELLKALSDSTRVRIACILKNTELSVNEIVSILGMGQSRVSRHLKILSDCGILECRRDGLWSFYSAASTGTGKQFFDSVWFLFEKNDETLRDVTLAREAIAGRVKGSRSYFNHIARDWDSQRKEMLGDVDLNSEIEKLIEPGSLVADLGCGNGELSVFLASRGFEVIGVDSSSRMIDAARSRSQSGKTKVDFRIGELEHLPFRDNEIDAAVVVLALHHVSAPADAIVECARVINKKGTIVIADFEKHSIEKMRDMYHDLWLGFSKRDLSRWSEKAGLSIKSYKPTELRSGLSLVFTVIKRS
jgi:ubiquinone/menaquinone biosynthesis C-methylase UbiE